MEKVRMEMNGTHVKDRIKKQNTIDKTAPGYTGPHEVELESWISCAPFEQLLGLEIVRAENGHATLTMPFVYKLAQGKGLAHGGAIVTLADTAVAMAIKSILPQGSRFGTISIASEFLAPVTKGTLTAKAEVTVAENRKIRGYADIFNDTDQIVMTFSSVFKYARDVKINAKCP